ncbi:MAG: hypothetical protein HC817_12100 [Saprospiraceae bacterium]|nr:hypothetical protein [Saprospiraceae bacterium]
MSDIFTEQNLNEPSLVSENTEVADNQYFTKFSQAPFEAQNTEGSVLRQLQKSTEVDEDMKKIVHIDLEITNEHKAAIKDDLTEKDLTPKLGFADWLGQFKKTKPLIESEKTKIESKAESIVEKPLESLEHFIDIQQKNRRYYYGRRSIAT